MNDLAIVLRAIPYSERDLIVTALTQTHGRLTALARNAVQSRRFGAALEPFTASEWTWAERGELPSLREAVVKRDFAGLRGDFQQMAIAGAMSEILLRVTTPPPDEPGEEALGGSNHRLFALHSNALAALEASKPGRAARVLNAFLLKLLHWHGTPPALEHCRRCGSAVSELSESEGQNLVMILDSAEGGWTCPACSNPSETHKSAWAVEEAGAPDLQKNGPAHWTRIRARGLSTLKILAHAPIRSVPEMTDAEIAPEADVPLQSLMGLLAHHIPGFDRTPLKSLRFVN